MIEKRQRITYYSPRRGRHFMTKRAAAMAEANERVKSWYPTEKAEYDEIGCTFPGSHFSEHPRLVAIRDRLAKRYMKWMK